MEIGGGEEEGGRVGDVEGGKRLREEEKGREGGGGKMGEEEGIREKDENDGRRHGNSAAEYSNGTDHYRHRCAKVAGLGDP